MVFGLEFCGADASRPPGWHQQEHSCELVLLEGLSYSSHYGFRKLIFQKTSTAELDVKSALQGSSFLQDLSTLTGVDLVGSEATASSLGLADSYTVSLFSSCAQAGTSGDSETKCSPSEFGYHFNPIKDLKLDTTGIEGTLGKDFLPSISYGTAARAIAITFILALTLALATMTLNLMCCCFPSLVFASMMTSVFGTLFQAAGAAASIAIFTNIKKNFNAELESAGIKTSLGNNLFIASWISFGLLFVNSILLVMTYRRHKVVKRRGTGRGRSIIDHTGMEQKGGDMNKGFGPPKRTRTIQLIKNHLPGFGGKQKYTQIEKQSGVRSITVTDHDTDRDVLVKKGFGGGEDEHDDERDELVRGSTRGIPMHSVGGKSGGTKAVETGYEPFRHA